MSGLPSNTNATSSSSSDRKSDPETASLASYTSTTALLKEKPKKETTAPAVDAKKLQEQALKSQMRFCL
ncbi:hypothetical protein BGZ63DRAFT_422659 [Mariannaea sp. PMI_226]|nr:hypothetical protein BGZ63DRAFT_422659 [Mariannaea sp. PMI_226]